MSEVEVTDSQSIRSETGIDPYKKKNKIIL